MEVGPNPQVSCSLVIPFYNEQAVLSATIERCIEWRRKQGDQIELVFVDDGSTDRSLLIAQSFGNSIKLVTYATNMGKGHAIRTGVLASNGELILTTDADLAYGTQPLCEVIRVLQSTDVDVVCGSRRLSDAGFDGYPFFRQIASVCFTAYVRALLRIPVSDTQCGLKGVRGDIGRELFAFCTVNGFAYDLEFLGFAVQKGCTMVEIPVTLMQHGDSGVSLFRDAIRMAVETLRIRSRIKSHERANRIS